MVKKKSNQSKKFPNHIYKYTPKRNFLGNLQQTKKKKTFEIESGGGGGQSNKKCK